jgi:hypothetical protein
VLREGYDTYLRVGQALAVAENPVFRNCLVAMRPKASCKDIPSSHDVGLYIHNTFVQWIKTLKSEISVSGGIKEMYYRLTGNVQKAPGKISATADGWSADTTKASFLGMTVHWVDVKDGKWSLCSEVVGFQPVSGDHTGWNLGRYFVGLCDRIGIFNEDDSKVRIVVWSHCDKFSTTSRILIATWHWQLAGVTLDNTSNNNTTCEVVENFHDRRRYKAWKAAENQLP